MQPQAAPAVKPTGASASSAASPYGSAQPMRRTSDADPDGDVFNPCTSNTGHGEPIALNPDGSLTLDGGAIEYNPTPDERAAADAFIAEGRAETASDSSAQ